MYQTTDILDPNKYSLKSGNADLLHEMSYVTIRYRRFGVQNRIEDRIRPK